MGSEMCIRDSTIHLWISALGNTALIASPNPVSPSTDTIMMSSTPRFLISFRTQSQYFALSFPTIHMPNTSLRPFSLMPCNVYRFLHGLIILSYMKMYGIHENNGIFSFQRTALLFLCNRKDSICHMGDIISAETSTP